MCKKHQVWKTEYHSQVNGSLAITERGERQYGIMRQYLLNEGKIMFESWNDTLVFWNILEWWKIDNRHPIPSSLSENELNCPGMSLKDRYWYEERQELSLFQTRVLRKSYAPFSFWDRWKVDQDICLVSYFQTTLLGFNWDLCRDYQQVWIQKAFIQWQRWRAYGSSKNCLRNWLYVKF